jgi:hypothetical protein
MKRSEYVSHLIRLMPASSIAWSAKHPNSYMSKTHVLLHYVALRQLGDITFLPNLINKHENLHSK